MSNSSGNITNNISSNSRNNNMNNCNNNNTSNTNISNNNDYKRKRNFTEEEKNFLVELVQQHQQIITSKDNKSSMKLLKDKVWSEIHQQFNENNFRNFNNSTRTLDQLKKCWENLRTKAKREYKQLNIGNSMEENNLQHKIISIIGDELDHQQSAPQYEFVDSFAIDYDDDFNLVELNQGLQQQVNKPQMKQILVNKLMNKQQQAQLQNQQSHQLQQENANEDNIVDEYGILDKKNPIIGKQQLIVGGKLIKNPENVIVENENDLEDLNGEEDLVNDDDKDEELIEEEDLAYEEDIAYEEELAYEDDEDCDLEDDVDEIVYEEDGMLTSVVRNKTNNGNNSLNSHGRQQANNNSVNSNTLKRFKKNVTLDDNHSSSNHSINNSLNSFKFSPQNKKYSSLSSTSYHQNNQNIRNYSNGLINNKLLLSKSLSKINSNGNSLSGALNDLKLREQRTRLRMARVELIANRKRAELELELVLVKLENERRKRQLLERQLENEQILHRVYRKKMDKL